MKSWGLPLSCDLSVPVFPALTKTWAAPGPVSVCQMPPLHWWPSSPPVPLDDIQQPKKGQRAYFNIPLERKEELCPVLLTCSTIEAKRPRARPWLSSRVMTALPNFTTKRRAYFSWLLSEKVALRSSPRFSGVVPCTIGFCTRGKECHRVVMRWEER